MVDPEYLAELRANAAEVRADLEEREQRQLEGDPQATHAEVLAATRPSMPAIVRKTNMDARPFLPDDDDNGDGDGDNVPPAFDDNQMEQLADILAQINMQLQDTIDAAIAPLRERVAMLEGQISTLLSVLGNNNDSRSIEASETIRKLQVLR